jgi:hypothetical protein
MTEPITDLWIATFSGRKVPIVGAVADDVEITDVAHSLSLQCRYNGAVREFYSVAEHCWLMSHAVSPENALWALLHDATEAYIGDLVRPVKRLLPDFVDIEDALMATIADKYGIALTMPAEVRDADNRICRDEMDALLANPDGYARSIDAHPYLGVEVQSFEPKAAEALYLARFNELTGGTHG